MWSKALGKIVNLNSLRKSQVLVGGWCFIHKKNGEAKDHLLFQREVASILLSTIFDLFGIN